MSLLTGIHIVAGSIALCAGSISLASRKGHHWHRKAGSAFVLSMLVMAGSSFYLAVMNREPDNMLVGSLTFYLVLTAWSALRESGLTKATNLAGTGMAIVIATISFSFAAEALNSTSGMKDGIAAGNFLALAAITFTFALFDAWFLTRRKTAYKSRLLRHLWRMCLAMFVAALSFFFGQAQLLPNFVLATYVNWLPILSVVCVAVFWLVRFSFGSGLTKKPSL